MYKRSGQERRQGDIYTCPRIPVSPPIQISFTQQPLMSSPAAITTVGVLGHTGRVGSHLVKHLIEYHRQGKVKLVILHRPSSNISNLPKGVETRMVDLTKDEPDKHLEAVKGLNVVM